ncbi:MAG: hypothetical protein ABSF92_07940 [Candidatus Acidiferrales bacterium]|jgi:hypothetical protein
MRPVHGRSIGATLLALLPWPVVFLVPGICGGPSRAYAQESPADAAEISRDLLYLAPTQIERRTSEESIVLEFTARWFSYLHRIDLHRIGLDASVPTPLGNEWQIEKASAASKAAEPAAKRALSFTIGGEDYTLTGSSDDDRATIALRRASGGETPVEAVVWTREELVPAWLPVLRRQRKGLTAPSLQKDLEVADPVLEDVAAAGESVWVALGHSKGEMELGIGTVVQFDLKQKQARVFHPGDLATCDVTHVAPGPSDTFFLGTRTQFEGAISFCAGLVKFHPSSGQIERIAPPGTPLAGAVVTALMASQNGGWVAADSGICSFAPDGAATCWRIVPTVSLKAAVPVVNRPGEKGADQLPPGDYEVLWANAGFFEVVTKDSLDAWLAADDFAEAAAHHFDADPYSLLNTASPPSAIRLLVKPGGDPLGGAIAYRAPLEKRPVPQGTPAGWVRVRAHIGWIPRGDLEVVPKLVPVESKP